VRRLLRRRGVEQYLLDRNDDAGRRFIDAVQKTLKNLVGMPGVGSPKNFADPRLADVRSWRVQGFANYLIYYLALDDGIDVLAILHGMRDVEGELRRRA
jgi:toxin ParE1/3/4